MKQCGKYKICGRRGESLVEALAAMLIITLASIALLTVIQFTTRLNAGAKAADSEFYEQQEAAETGPGTSSGTVTVTGGSGGGSFRQDYGVKTAGSASSGALRAYNPQ